MTFFSIFNIVLSWILGFLLMIINPGELFNPKNILELEKLEHSSPLERIFELDSKFPFFGKTNKQGYTYQKLINLTIKKDENCPIGKKKCGYFTEDSILRLEDIYFCPINDIIINNQTIFSADNITYNRV